MLRISVVLPAPFGPRSPTNAPSRTEIETFRSTSARPYPAIKPLMSSIGAGPEVRLDDARVALNLAWRALRNELAVIEHVDHIGEVHDDLHVVLDDEQRDV